MGTLIRKNGQQQDVSSLSWDPARVMRELISWDPFAEMLPALGRQPVVFNPHFEVRETQDAYVFKADLPGLDDKDVELMLTGNRLTISGVRRAEARQEGETFYAYERSYGHFSRSFTLPSGADADHAEADMKDGVLTLRIPKKPEHQPRKISLKTLSEKVRGALSSQEKGSA